MNGQEFDPNNLRISSPCSQSWDEMVGDDKKRFCGGCKMVVYDLSEMRPGEIRELVLNTDGRLCTRLYRRSDGTVITKECPIGVKVIRKRISRIAGAALASILGLFSIGYGQKTDAAYENTGVRITRVSEVPEENTLSGTVKDGIDGPISFAKITLFEDEKEIFKTETDEDGNYLINPPKSGTYSLKILATGFRSRTISNLSLDVKEKVQVDVILEVGGIGETVVVTKEVKRKKNKGRPHTEKKP